jgi:SNF2 family DNA or RNA helicase
MELIDNKALLITVRNPERVTSVIDSAVHLGEITEGIHELLVKWDYSNAVSLTKLGFKKVPSTIMKDYQWPGRYTPMAHQKETAGFVINNHRCFVFNEQGTGKTMSAAWAMDYLMLKGLVKRVLVICPLSIMKPSWQADLFSALPHRSVGIAHGAPKTRRTVIEGNYEFVVLNFDGIEIVLDELKKAKFDCIIVDEANALKNTQTNRWKAFKQLVKEDTRLVLMTGTPAAQSPEDAYGLAKLVSPHQVPAFYSGWRELVMQKINQFKWIPRPRAKDIVHKALQPAIRYTKEECLDLPDITYETREVPLTPQQEKYYEMLRKQLLVEAAGESVSAVNAAAKLNKLLQISCGAVYSDDGTPLYFDITKRLGELEAVIDESLKKVIVFAPFTHTIEVIEKHLTKKKITCAVINGDVSANKRAMHIKHFQELPDPRVLIIQPQAAAHGITLTAANTVVWFGPTSSVETYLQANARAHRKGQDHKVTVIMLQGSPAEKHLYQMLNEKVDNHQKLIDLYSNILGTET